MTLHRFVVVSFLVFILGLVALYSGVNRVPLRQQGGTHEMHKSSLQVPAASNTKLVATIPVTIPVAKHVG
ncbi:MAG: hypothetical protein K0R22_1808 [Sporomusa sp.]|jgi:hypothetical protein|nr:hypothetical protein [Sporomusa sp.]